MQFRLPDANETNSALRHVYTAVATGTSVLVLVGLSQGDATVIGHAVHQIGDGIASILAGITALVPVVTGLYAALSASKSSLLQRMQKDPEIKQVVTVPGTEAAAIAAQLPGDKVTSK